jgi:glycosyltransferase involved in cell wall biosynthesis
VGVKPRVLAVCFFSSPGSVADNFYTLCRALARHTTLSVLTSTPLQSRAIEGVADISYLDFSRFHPVRWLNPAQWVRMARFCRQHQYDLLFIYSEHPVHAAVCRMARAGRRLFWILDPVPHSGSISTIVRIYEMAKRSLLRQSDRIVVACEMLRDDVVDRFHIPDSRVITSFHGVLDNLVFPDLLDGAEQPENGAARPPVSPQAPRTTHHPRDIDILFFGRIEAYKGVDVLLEAVRLLRGKGLEPRVTVAGTGPFQIAPTPGVTVENRYVPDRELAGMVARSRIVVMPYRDATGSQVPQIAFTYGTPVVASLVGCLPEYVEDGVNGLLVRPGDAAQLAGALARLLQDAALWAKMSRAARKRAATVFDNDTLVRKLVKNAIEERRADA